MQLSNMSGNVEGSVQENLIMQAGATKSVHFHCFAHRLNLVLEKSVNNLHYLTAVNDIFDNIGSINRYLKGSPKSHALLKEKVFLHGSSSTGKTALHPLSDTRCMDITFPTYHFHSPADVKRGRIRRKRIRKEGPKK